MGLKRIYLDVYLDQGEDKEPAMHTVEVKHVDRLEAEVKGPAMGLPVSIEQAPQTWSTFWAWVALKREGLYPGKWQEFRGADCVAVQDHEDPEEPDGVDVDPTQPAGDMPSPSF